MLPLLYNANNFISHHLLFFTLVDGGKNKTAVQLLRMEGKKAVEEKFSLSLKTDRKERKKEKKAGNRLECHKKGY
jgi:hypothetical protein